jgi:hypothetical protein
LVIIPSLVAQGWFMSDFNKEVLDVTLSGDPQRMQALNSSMMSQIGIVGLLVNFALVLPMSSIAVGWHRFLLRHEQPATGAAFRLDGVVRDYALLALLFTLIFTGPTLVRFGLERVLDGTTTAGVLTSSALVLIPLILCPFLLRLSVMLPGVAVENPEATMAGAWAKSRGNGLRILLIGVAVSLPFVLVGTPLSLFTIAFRDSAAAVIGIQVVAQLILLLGTMALVTVLSLAYQHFYERETPYPAAVTA